MALSGQTSVTTAGTAVALGSQVVGFAILVKALPANTGVMYVGNDGSGDVTSSNGFPLSAGDVVIFEHVSDLKEIKVDSSVNGEGVAWLILGA